MPSFVLDTSIALKWFLADEEDRTDSLILLKNISDTNRPIVPWLWFYEIGNALTMAVRRNRIQIEQLEEMVLMLERMPIDIDTPDRGDLLRLSVLARKHALTTYDAAYLSLALRENLPLATSDTALKRAAIAEGALLI
jgi:predicted nucleic acid-binding protein